MRGFDGSAPGLMRRSARQLKAAWAAAPGRGQWPRADALRPRSPTSVRAAYEQYLRGAVRVLPRRALQPWATTGIAGHAGTTSDPALPPSRFDRRANRLPGHVAATPLRYADAAVATACRAGL